ncbi:MAG: cache domain-containing protein [Blautia marasmi]
MFNISSRENKYGNEPVKKRERSVSGKIIRACVGADSVTGYFNCYFLHTAAGAISDLNEELLDVQTDYAVSVVDDFFSSKIASVSMFEENAILQDYFEAVNTAEDLDRYEGRDVVIKELSGALSVCLTRWSWRYGSQTRGRTATFFQAVRQWMQIWKTSYGASPCLTGRKNSGVRALLGSRPGESIVSVVSPVFSEDGADIAGYAGLDVFVSSLSQLLSEIKVGEEGYLEVISDDSDYIYSDDPAAMGKMWKNWISPMTTKKKVKAVTMEPWIFITVILLIPPCSETVKQQAGWPLPHCCWQR